MAHAPTEANARPAGNTTPSWGKLTWDDLYSWSGSGSVDKGESYARSGRVSGLTITPEGRLLAWVEGSERYATTVELLTPDGEGLRLRSLCTCPLGVSGCKHAVAVVLAYLQGLREKKPVPPASDTDRRWQRLHAGPHAPIPPVGEVEDGDEDDLEAEATPARGKRHHQPEAQAREPLPHRPADRPAQQTGEQPGEPEPLHAFLKAKSQAELVEMLLAVARRHPKFARELKRQQMLDTGQADELIQRARKEIRKRTSERAWQNEWSGEGHIPDYTHLQRLFETLLQRGQADALLRLGRDLLRAGNHQVEEAQDEGDTAEAIADCLRVVFRAVGRSSLSNPEKILYAIDAHGADEFDLTAGADEILDADWPAADWSVVADDLARRLRSRKKPEGPGSDRSYSRDALVDQLIDALEAAGRQDEVLPLCEAEAPVTGNYGRLVNGLIEAGRLDDAERWAREGLAKTSSAWHVAHPLRDQLREIAEKREQWPLVAAYWAEDFFDHPSVDSLKKLLEAAGRADCESQVRAAALHFLETGVRPAGTEPPAETPTPAKAPARGRGKKSAARADKAASQTPAPPQAADWPLPPLPAFAARSRSEGPAAFVAPPRPHPEILLQLALAEHRPDDALALYDRLEAGKTRSPWEGYYYGCRPEDVADAVAATHPDRALAIYQKQVEQMLRTTDASSYNTVASYLKKIRSILAQHGRAREWPPLLAAVREQHRRKRKLLEILDRLDNRPIIES